MSVIEQKWVNCFVQHFEACGIGRGTMVAILCETQSRAINVLMSRLALTQLGATLFTIEMPTRPQTEVVPIRSTGASDVVNQMQPVISALSQVEVIVDCTVEGMLHTPEIAAILAGGARLFMISNEHPDVLERFKPDAELEGKVRKGVARIKSAKKMLVRSGAGTNLEVVLGGSPAGGNWGYCTERGTRSHWPGGLIATYPNKGSVNGRVVFAPGDANLTFKRYFEQHVVLDIENDFVTRIEGDNLDAELMRSYLAAWNDRNAYAVSHVGWGMNPRARWDAMVMYDKQDINGTELRVFAGNFLFSTGANEHAGRFTKGHFDLPMRNCTVALDDEVIVERGVLQGELVT